MNKYETDSSTWLARKYDLTVTVSRNGKVETEKVTDWNGITRLAKEIAYGGRRVAKKKVDLVDVVGSGEEYYIWETMFASALRRCE